MEHVEVQGETVPALGFGTWELRGPDCREGVRHALELGYRHIDTARKYGNETEVGGGISDSGIPREEIFLVTKVPASALDRDSVTAATEASLRELGTDHLDLLLIHQPSSDVPLEETLGAMREQQDAGRVRHLGVSNFDVDLMLQATEHAPILTNQIEYHPGNRQDAIVAAARERDILVTAYSPLDTGSLVGDATLEEIGRAYGKTAQQVAIRWLLDQELVATIPRSSDPVHRQENLDVFDFALTDDDRRRIAALGDG
ncbi:MAG: aldo/keto reductase [Actinobacteria bacterium]|nr:aldo/keto reductase [Actinomycetota bacterium]